MNKIGWWIAACLLVPSSAPAAAAAQASPTAAEVASAMEAFGAWVLRINDAVAPLDAATARFAQQMEGMVGRTPSGAEAAAFAGRLRAEAAEAKATAILTRSALSRIEPFAIPLPTRIRIDPNELLRDARSAVDRMVAYLDSCDRLAAAIGEGDAEAAQSAARDVMDGGILLIDNQALAYRRRQAMLDPGQPAHHMAATTVRLYRAMSVATRRWHQAAILHQPGAAAKAQREEFAGLATELESHLREGRSALDRQNSTVARLASAAPSAAEAELIEKMRRMSDVVETYFAEGDALLAWLRRHAEDGGSSLAQQERPELVRDLALIERKLVARMRDAAAIMAETR